MCWSLPEAREIFKRAEIPEFQFSLQKDWAVFRENDRKKDTGMEIEMFFQKFEASYSKVYGGIANNSYSRQRKDFGSSQRTTLG